MWIGRERSRIKLKAEWIDQSLGSLSLSAAAANTAWKTRQSSLLSSWLAQCDDVTSRDIIIILINTVTHHQDFRVGGVRGSHKIGRQPLPFLPKQSEEFKKSCNSQRAADWQAGARRIWTKWGDREQLNAIGWVRTSTRRLVVAICEWWTCSEDKRVEKNYPGESHTSIMCTIVGDLFIMWQEEVIFKQIGEGGEGCNYRMIMWKFSTTSMV